MRNFVDEKVLIIVYWLIYNDLLVLLFYYNIVAILKLAR